MRGAAIAGGAYAAGRNAANGEAEGGEKAVPAAAPPAGIGDEQIAELEKIARLRDQGILTDAEFEARKATILAG